MWQKDLKKYKKTQPVQQTPTITINKPSESEIKPEISFSEYCQQLNITAIKHDTVELKNLPTAPRKEVGYTKNNNNLAGFSFIDSEDTAREFYQHGQKNLPKELRSGKIFFNRTIDVHNLNRNHALDLIEHLLSNANGGDSLKIIHGVGLNSEHNQPILLGIIRKYLRLSPQILAYSYGSPEQGGNGVTLVKLMR